MLTPICIWLRTRNWSRFVRRAAITYLVMLAGVRGADLISIARVLSPSAMIGCALLMGDATCCVVLRSIYYTWSSP
jgi:hypothetical protein